MVQGRWYSGLAGRLHPVEQTSHRFRWLWGWRRPLQHLPPSPPPPACLVLLFRVSLDPPALC